MTQKTAFEKWLYKIVSRKSDISLFWKYRTLAINKRGLYRLYSIKKYYDYCGRFGASIPLSAQINGEIVFPHGLSGIFISSDAKIGGGTIFQQVTIGSNRLCDSKGFGAPTIGNNVIIGAGAKIIGNVNIGDNVRIGANCIVFSDVPNNSTVVMNAPRIIQHMTVN